MKKLIYLFFVLCFIIVFSGCEEVTIEPTQDPITPTEEYGDGLDGVLEVNIFGTIVNEICSLLISTPSTGEVSLTLEDAAGFNEGDEVFINTAQGVIDTTSGPGMYEFGRINSIVGTTIILIEGLVNDYVAGDLTFVYRVPNYRSVTISDGASIEADVWNAATGGGVVVFRAAESIYISASGKIDVSGMGYQGSDRQEYDDTPGIQGEGYPGLGVVSSAANGNGGGGGGNTLSGGAGGGHAYVGSGGAQSGGVGGEAVGNRELTTLFFGGAGGTGHDNDNTGALNPNGGHGGGIIYIAGPEMTLINVLSNGSDGNFSVDQDGGAGGGAGGSIYIVGDTINIIGNVTALGGEGFLPPNPSGGKGGNGSVGRIRIEAEEINGSTSPFAYMD